MQYGGFFPFLLKWRVRDSPASVSTPSMKPLKCILFSLFFALNSVSFKDKKIWNANLYADLAVQTICLPRLQDLAASILTSYGWNSNLWLVIHHHLTSEKSQAR